METPKPHLKSRSKGIPLEAETDEDREPTKEEIMDDIRQGLRDVLAGKEGRPALEVLDEIDRELMDDANDCLV